MDYLPSVPVAELRGHEDGPIHIVRFTADGKYCITGSNDRTVRLWNPTRIDPAYRPPPPPSASGTNTSSSSSFISSQEYYGGRRVDGRLDSKQLQNQHLPSALPMQTYTDGNIHPIHCIDTNSSSTILLSASDKTLFATDLVTAQCKQKWWGLQWGKKNRNIAGGVANAQGIFMRRGANCLFEMRCCLIDVALLSTTLYTNYNNHLLIKKWVYILYIKIKKPLHQYIKTDREMDNCTRIQAANA